MPKQPAIPGLRDALKKKVTRREKFLLEMDEVVPWVRLVALMSHTIRRSARRAVGHRCRWK